MNNTGGKGSAPRPIGVDKETFNNNWDTIFSKKKEEPKEFVSDVSQCGSINETFAFMEDKHKLKLFAIGIKDTDMIYLVNAKNHEEAIDVIICNGFQGFSENVNDYNFIKLADARPFVTEAGLELYKDNIAIMVVSQLPKFTYENDKNICGLNFEFKYSSIDQTNFVFNPKQMVWYYKGSGVGGDKWFVKDTNFNLFQTKKEKSILESDLDSNHSGLINNSDFTNDAAGWKSDGKTHVINHSPGLNLYLVRLSKECFDLNKTDLTLKPCLIAAENSENVIVFHENYCYFKSLQNFDVAYIGKASPNILKVLLIFNNLTIMKIFKLTDTTSTNKNSVIAADNSEKHARVSVYEELKQKGWPVDQSKVHVDELGESTIITQPRIFVINIFNYHHN